MNVCGSSLLEEAPHTQQTHLLFGTVCAALGEIYLCGWRLLGGGVWMERLAFFTCIFHMFVTRRPSIRGKTPARWLGSFWN